MELTTEQDIRAEGSVPDPGLLWDIGDRALKEIRGKL